MHPPTGDRTDAANASARPSDVPARGTRAGWRRWPLLALGYVLFGLGFAGIFVPLLPTVIFWILAAVCFTRTSPAMRARLLAWPGVGGTIEAYLARGELSDRSKRAALFGLAAAGGLTLVILRHQPLVAGLLAVLFVGIALYIVTRPAPGRSASP